MSEFDSNEDLQLRLSRLAVLCKEVQMTVDQIRTAYQDGLFSRLRLQLSDLYSQFVRLDRVGPSEFDIPEWPRAEPWDQTSEKAVARAVETALTSGTKFLPLEDAEWREELIAQFTHSLENVFWGVTFTIWHIENPAVARQDALWASLFQFWTHWGTDGLLENLSALHNLELPTVVTDP